MRHSHHATGSPAAQAALASLAGWAPSRRSFLSSMLVIGSASAAVATATAIPAVSSAATPASAVSPRMVELIADFTRLSSALDAAEASGDLAAFDTASEARRPALEVLVFERPESLTDLAAKMTVLAQFMQNEDIELFVFRRLAEDATLLAGRG